MKFLSFLKKEQREEKPVAKKIEIRATDILEWFEKTFQNRLNSAKSEANDKRSRIDRAFRDIQNSVIGLERAGFSKTDKVYTMANMLKDTFVTKVKNSSLPALTETNYTALSNFHSDAKSIVNGFLKMSPKQAFFLSKYFAKESGKVMAGIKQTKRELSELKQFLEKEAKILKMEEELKRLDAKQKELADRIREIEEEKAGLKKRAKSVEREMEDTNSSLKALLDSKQWKEFEEAGNRIEKIQSELEDTCNTLRSELESVKRPLKKIAHTTKRPVLKPFETVMEGREKALLDALKESTSLSLKPQEREKVERLMQRLESDIPLIVKNHRELAKNKQDMERAIEAFPEKNRKELLEENLARKKSEMESMKGEILEKTNSRKHAESQLQELREEMGKVIAENTEKEFKVSWLE